MTLITCPDCGKEISSAAISCPSCGRPISPAKVTTADVKRGSAYMIGGVIVLAASITVWYLTLAPVDYGMRPVELVGEWMGTDNSGAQAVLHLKANGHYSEKGNPGNTSHTRGVWGVFPQRAGRDPRFSQLCLNDGSEERCTIVALGAMEVAGGFLSPYFYVRYERREH